MKSLVFLLWWSVPLAAMSYGKELQRCPTAHIVIDKEPLVATEVLQLFPEKESAESRVDHQPILESVGVQRALISRPTHIMVDTSARALLIPIDHQYENRVLHACLQNDSAHVRDLLRDRDRRIFSEHFFQDMEQALDASQSCRPTECCLVGAGIAGTIGTQIGKLWGESSGGYANPVYIFLGCSMGMMPTALAWLLNLSSKREELKSDLRRFAYEKDRSLSVQQQPPPSMSMSYSPTQ